MGLACTKAPSAANSTTSSSRKRRIKVEASNGMLSSSTSGKLSLHRRSKGMVRKTFTRNISKSSLFLESESTMVSYVSETEDELDEEESIGRIYASDLQVLSACLRCWLEKADLRDCAPTLVRAGVFTLEELKAATVSMLDGHGISKSRAQILLKAAARAPHESSTLGYLELLSDVEWLDEIGIDLRVVEPVALRGSVISLSSSTPEKLYRKPNFRKVSDQHMGQVEPIRSCSTFSRSMASGIDKTCSFSHQLESIATKHVQFVVTETLSLNQWSKETLTVKNLDGSKKSTLYVSLGNHIFSRELCDEEECTVDIGLASNVRPIGIQIGDFLFSFTGSGRRYPDGPSHFGDTKTLLVFPSDESDTREMLWEIGFVDVSRRHYVDSESSDAKDSRESKQSNSSTISHWGEIFAANLDRKSRSM